jgi:flagellar motility protein MotE (MotC chaperone)
VKSRRFFRLLPGLILVLAGLLALKTPGLVREALAQAAAKPAADAMAAAPAPVNKDFAGADTEIATAAENDVLTSLAKRRSELDGRQSEIDAKGAILAATEARVDAKIAQLKQLQTQIAGLLAQRDAEQEKQVAALVKTYSAMKPASAARIFESLDDDVLVPVAQEMKSDVLAPILAAMNPASAQKLTLKLANKLALPPLPTDPAPAPAAGPAAPSPGPAPAPQAAAGAAKSGG